MVILLDLDGTVIVNGKLHPRFFEFQEWVKDNKHKVILWTSHDEGNVFAELMGFEFVSKNSGVIPKGYYLIDDEAPHFYKYCDVRYYSKSIDNFLNNLGITNA